MKKHILFLGLLMLMLAGCAGNNNDNVTGIYELNQDRDGSNLLTTDDMNRQSGEFTDVTRGHEMSDQNPNYVNISGTRNNYGLDVDKAREVISRLENFEPGQVWITGDVLRVTAFYEGRLTERQRAEFEERIRSRLFSALPRYNIEVSVEEDRT